MLRPDTAHEIAREGHLARVAQGSDRLDDVGIGNVRVLLDLRRDGGDVGRLVGEAGEAALDRQGIDCWQIALQVHHVFEAPLRVAQRQGLGNAVRAGRQCGVGDNGVAAVGAHRIGDLHLGGGNQHLADICLRRPLPALDDHGQPVDVGQGLSGKPCGGHPGGDQDDGISVFNHELRGRRGKMVQSPLTLLRRG